MTKKRIRKVLILLDEYRTYCRTMIKGISKYARLKGMWHFFGIHDFDYTTKLIDESSGIIISEDMPRKLLDQIKKKKKPCVFIRNKATESEYPWPEIIGDNVALAEMAFDYLYGLGFRKMAYCGDAGADWSHERKEVFGKIVADHDLPFYDYFIRRGKKSDYFAEIEKLKKWLITLPKPVAILVSPDDVGLFLLQAAKYTNINIPGEIAVLGVDNDELICELCTPLLSSISRNIEMVGYEAAQTLDEMLNGKKIEDKKILVEPITIVKRESTTILVTGDQDVARAISYIQQNYRSPIQADDVADHVHVSPKTLHRKFKKTFGASVCDKINEFRLGRISHLLTETQYPISHIADEVGKRDYKHLSRLFKKMKGVTPSEYRKKFSSI